MRTVLHNVEFLIVRRYARMLDCSSPCKGPAAQCELRLVSDAEVSASKTEKLDTDAESKPYKYGKELRTIEGCPFDAGASFQDASYRIVRADIKNDQNFKPVAIVYPTRFANRDERCRCASWGLSLFETRNQLSKHIAKMEQTNRLWRKLVGDHGVKLKLSDAHGRRTKCNAAGHFTFFEYVDFEPSDVIEEHFSLFP